MTVLQHFNKIALATLCQLKKIYVFATSFHIQTVAGDFEALMDDPCLWAPGACWL